MTQLIQRLDATDPVAGWIDGTNAPTIIKNGIPYDRGALALDFSSAISYYHMGLPFTAVGRLAAALDVAVVRISNGAAPFTAANRLAFSEDPAVSYIGAIGFTANSMISLAASSLNSTAIFTVLLQNTLVPGLATGSATPTFTRASTASVPDFEGIVHTAKAGEARFKGARRVHNYAAQSESILDWAAVNTTINSATNATFTSAFGKITSPTLKDDFTGGDTLVCRVLLSGDGGVTLRFQDDDSVNNAVTNLTLNTTPTWYSIGYTLAAGAKTFVNLVIDKNNRTATEVTVGAVQYQNKTGSSTPTIPDEYVSTGVGTGVELAERPVFAAANWDAVAGWTNSSNTLVATAAVASTTPFDASMGDIIANEAYVVTVVVDSISGDALRVRLGNILGDAIISTAGTHTQTIVTSTNAKIRFLPQGGSGLNCVVSNFSVKKASHGANVDGVQYFNTLNGNTVSDGTVADGPELVTTPITASDWVATGSNTVSDAADGFVKLEYVDNTTGGDLDLGALYPVLETVGAQYYYSVEAYSGTGGSVNFVMVGEDNPTVSVTFANTSAEDKSFNAEYLTGSLKMRAGGLSSGESVYIKISSIKAMSSNVVTEATGIPITNMGAEGVTNGDFAADSDWTKGASWTISGGKANFAGSGSYLSQEEIVGAGVAGTFLVTWDQTITAGARTRFFARNHDDSAGIPVISSSSNLNATNAVGSGEFWAYVQSTDGYTFSLLSDGSSGTIDNVSVKPVHYYADAKGPFGYMAEAAATNICLQSEDFSTTWVATRASVSTNATVAPDGTTTADKIIDSVDNNNHGAWAANLGITDYGDYCFSIHLKAAELDFAQLKFTLNSNGTINEVQAAVDLNTGAMTTLGTVTGSGSELLPDGWVRVWVAGEHIDGNGTQINYNVYTWTNGTATGNPTYVGTGTDGIYVWGAQVEKGTFPTAHIPTTTTAVTRNADVLTYDDAGNISDVAGTAYTEASTDWEINPASVFLLQRGSTGRIGYINAGEESYHHIAYDGTNLSEIDGVSRFNSPLPTVTSWGDALTAYSTGTLLPDPTPAAYDGTMGSGDIAIGCRNDSASAQWGGTIRNVKIFSTELTAEEVQNIT